MVSFKVPASVILGQNNTVWETGAAAEFSFSKLNSRAILPIRHVGSFKRVQAIENSFCYSSSYCCKNAQGFSRSYDMVEVPGSPTFDFYESRDLSSISSFDMFLNFTVGSFSTNLNLSTSNLYAQFPQDSNEPLIRAQASVFYLGQQKLSFFPSFYFVIDRSWVHPPFLVPVFNVNPAQLNSIGLTPQNWVQLLKANNLPCNLADIQDTLRVSSGPPNDQFEKFYASSVASTNPNAVFSISKSDININSQQPFLYFQTTDYDSVLLDIRVRNTTEFNITQLFASPIVIGKGFYLIPSTSTFFIWVKNNASTPGFVNIVPTTCCYAPVGAVVPTLSCVQIFSPKGIVLYPQEEYKFNFSTALLTSGSAGYCSFRMTAGNNFTKNIDVGFSATTTLAPSSPPTCSAPNFLVDASPYYFCQSICSFDETWNTTTGKCDPVNCFTRYLGGRNYFHSETGVCKPFEFVPPPIAVPVSPSPAPSAPNGPPMNGTDAFPEVSPGNYTINCGPRGTFNPTELTCTCDLGWATDMDQPIYTFKFCDMATLAPPDSRSQTPQKAFKGFNPFAKVIILVIAFVVLLILLIVFIKCKVMGNKKRKKRREEEKNKTDSKHTDGNDSDDNDDDEVDYLQKGNENQSRLESDSDQSASENDSEAPLESSDGDYEMQMDDNYEIKFEMEE